MMYSALGIGVVTTVALICTSTCSGPKKKAAPTDAAVASAASCIFCPQSDANTRSVVEKQKIGKNKDVCVLLDTTPILPGHILLTTTQHKVRAHELSDDEVLAEHEALKQVVAMYKAKYGAENYLILQKNGKAAGQSIAHYHKHVYPIATSVERTRANWNFAVNFFTFGFCSAKLQGEKLATLQRELTPMLHLTDESATTANISSSGAASSTARADAGAAVEKKDGDEKSTGSKKIAAVASCALCPAIASAASSVQPLVEIVVQVKQIGPGHVIIKTTRNVEKAHERTPEEVLACHKALQKVAQIYKTVFGTDDYMQIQENGKAAGQEFPHFYTQVYAVPKTKHEYMRQIEALVKYSFPSTRSFDSAKPGTLQEKFVKALAE